MIRARLVTQLPRGLRHAGIDTQRIIAQEVRTTLEQATTIVHREVLSRTHAGATERLRGSITREIHGTPAEIRGIVTTALSYAIPVEEGSRPHWAPIAPLLLWAQRVLGDSQAAYAVRWAIARRGTKGHFMFRDGWRAALPQIRPLFQGLLSRIKQGLLGK